MQSLRIHKVKENGPEGSRASLKFLKGDATAR